MTTSDIFTMKERYDALVRTITEPPQHLDAPELDAESEKDGSAELPTAGTAAEAATTTDANPSPSA